MNNKRGGFGAKLLFVLILMLASAAGGAYGYRVLDGKMAVNDAMKAVEDVDVSDYDTAERTIIQGYIDDATSDLEKAQTRKEVYEIIADFISDVDKVQTSQEKELEEALRQAEEAKNKYNDQNEGDSSSTGSTTESDDSDSSYKSNDLTDSQDGTEDSGFLNSLLGGLSSGSSGN